MEGERGEREGYAATFAPAFFFLQQQPLPGFQPALALSILLYEGGAHMPAGHIVRSRLCRRGVLTARAAPCH